MCRQALNFTPFNEHQFLNFPIHLHYTHAKFLLITCDPWHCSSSPNEPVGGKRSLLRPFSRLPFPASDLCFLGLPLSAFNYLHLLQNKICGDTSISLLIVLHFNNDHVFFIFSFVKFSPSIMQYRIFNVICSTSINFS